MHKRKQPLVRLRLYKPIQGLLHTLESILPLDIVLPRSFLTYPRLLKINCKMDNISFKAMKSLGVFPNCSIFCFLYENVKVFFHYNLMLMKIFFVCLLQLEWETIWIKISKICKIQIVWHDQVDGLYFKAERVSHVESYQKLKILNLVVSK